MDGKLVTLARRLIDLDHEAADVRKRDAKAARQRRRPGSAPSYAAGRQARQSEAGEARGAQ